MAIFCNVILCAALCTVKCEEFISVSTLSGRLCTFSCSLLMLQKICNKIIRWFSNFKAACVAGLARQGLPQEHFPGSDPAAAQAQAKMLRRALGGLWGRPRNLHSLEQLKYLHSVLRLGMGSFLVSKLPSHHFSKNQTVTESNKGLLVETIRSIAEILIWGDQNDSSVFDFFLER